LGVGGPSNSQSDELNGSIVGAETKERRKLLQRRRKGRGCCRDEGKEEVAADRYEGKEEG
jgi:hypothetical protein